MKNGTAIFLQSIIVLVGIGALAFLLGEPHLEGRNAQATPFEIYCKDPFLAYVYVGSIPFFVALYRAFVVCGDIRRKGAYSQFTVVGLFAIKRCAVAIIGFAAGGIAFIILYGDGEDRPPGIMMGLFVTIVASVTATTAAMLARRLQRALTRAEHGPG
jgi:hypothetical protein